jgi:hypothetical protein
MACDEWEHEYHLTRLGWISGNFFFRGTLAKQVLSPSDRVMTVVQENMYSSADGPVKTTWRCNWKSSDHTAEEINALLRQFGYRPPDMLTAPISNQMVRNTSKQIIVALGNAGVNP